MNEIKAMVLAFQFLARLYLPFMIDGPKDLFARSVRYFPLVGLVIGGLDALLFWASAHLFSPATCAVLVLVFDTCLTGGLHVDGLADTVDGISSHRDRERMLEIMKDSRIGTFGVLGVIGLFAIKWAMLTEAASLLRDAQTGSKTLITILVLIPVFSRALLGVLIGISKYARPEGMGGLFFEHKKTVRAGWPMLAILLILFVAIACLTGFSPALILVLAANGTVTALVFRAICYKKLGGMTGDTLGAALEMAEAVMLIAAAIWTIA